MHRSADSTATNRRTPPLTPGALAAAGGRLCAGEVASRESRVASVELTDADRLALSEACAQVLAVRRSRLEYRDAMIRMGRVLIPMRLRMPREVFGRALESARVNVKLASAALNAVLGADEFGIVIDDFKSFRALELRVKEERDRRSNTKHSSGVRDECLGTTERKGTMVPMRSGDTEQPAHMRTGGLGDTERGSVITLGGSGGVSDRIPEDEWNIHPDFPCIGADGWEVSGTRGEWVTIKATGDQFNVLTGERFVKVPESSEPLREDKASASIPRSLGSLIPAAPAASAKPVQMTMDSLFAAVDDARKRVLAIDLGSLSEAQQRRALELLDNVLSLAGSPGGG
jgi:hypothetical protein